MLYLRALICWFLLLLYQEATAKTFVFTGTFWANGNFNLPGVPSDTDNVLINKVCVLNFGVSASCNNLDITEDMVVLQNQSSLTVHGNLTINSTVEKAGIALNNKAQLVVLGQVYFKAYNDANNSQIDLSPGNGLFEIHGNILFQPSGSIKGGNQSTVRFMGIGNQFLPVQNCQYNHVEINITGWLGLPNNLTGGSNYGQISGNFMLNSGTFRTLGFQFSGLPGKTLNVGPLADLVISSTYGFPTGFTNITLQHFSNVTYNRNGNQDIKPLTYWNLKIAGSGTKSLTDSTYINGVLMLQEGEFKTNNYLTILSNQFGTGSINYLDSTVTFNGKVKMQRQIPYENYSVAPFIAMGSWLKNQTLEHLTPPFEPFGIPGTPNSNQLPNFYNYHPDSNLATGWPLHGYIPNNISESLPAGQPFYLNPQNQTSLNFTLFGDIFSGNYKYEAKGKIGWHVVANPYPSAVLVNLKNYNQHGFLSPTTMDEFGNYSPLDIKDTLQSGEAMLIYATHPQAYFTFEERHKIASPGKNGVGKNAPFYSNLPNHLGIILHREDSTTDKTKLVFDELAGTPGFDSLVDFLKHKTPLKNNHISILGNQTELALNRVPHEIQGEIEIPILVKSLISTGNTSLLKISFENVISLISNNYCLIVEDRLVGTSFGLTNDTTISFSHNDTVKNPRFFIKISQPAILSTQNSTCLGKENGKANIQLKTPGVYDFTWQTATGNVIAFHPNINTTDSISGLKENNYFVQVNGLPGCSVIGKSFTILEPDKPLVAQYYLVGPQPPYTEGVVLEFKNTSIGAQNYYWNFGIGNTITGVTSPFFQYTQQGDYQATLIAENVLCRDTTSRIITITNPIGIEQVNLKNDVSLFYNNQHNLLSINQLGKTKYKYYKIFDVAGKLIVSGTIASYPVYEVVLDNRISNGIYIVQLEAPTNMFRKKIFIR